MVKIVFEPVLPDKPFDSDVYVREWSQALKTETKPKLQALFDLTATGWENPPIFRGTFSSSPGRLEMFVRPEGKNKNQYELVSRGSPPHTIRPRRPGGFLRFRPGYSAGTARGRLQSRRAQSFGALTSARAVQHPGFEAREFDELIAELHRPDFIRDMEDATDRAARRQ